MWQLLYIFGQPEISSITAFITFKVWKGYGWMLVPDDCHLGSQSHWPYITFSYYDLNMRFIKKCVFFLNNRHFMPPASTFYAKVDILTIKKMQYSYNNNVLIQHNSSLRFAPTPLMSLLDFGFPCRPFRWFALKHFFLPLICHKLSKFPSAEVKLATNSELFIIYLYNA